MQIHDPGEELLFHYTNAEGTRGIVKNNCLWATHPLHMNDARELSHGIEVFRDIVTGINEGSHESRELLAEATEYLNPTDEITFVTSFSADADSLSQWRAYADDAAGYALGFRQHSLLASRPRATASHRWTGPFLLRVEYEQHAQERILLPAVQSLLSALDSVAAASRDERLQICFALIWGLTRTFLGFKNHGFREEREFRLIAHLQDSAPDVPVRSTRFGLSPYVELELPADALQEIWLGPRIDKATGGLGVRALMKRYYPDASYKIWSAEASYRGQGR